MDVFDVGRVLDFFPVDQFQLLCYGRTTHARAGTQLRVDQRLTGPYRAGPGGGFARRGCRDRWNRRGIGRHPCAGLQRCVEFLCRRVTFVARLGQRTGQHRVYGRWQRGIDGACRYGVLRDDALNNGKVAVAVKWAFAGEHLVQHHTGGKQVGARVNRQPLNLLRRHVF